MKKARLQPLLLPLFWLLGLFNTADAQEVVFSARAAAEQVGIQDPFEIQYRIENVQNLTEFKLPTLTQAQILSGPSRNIQYREINGQRTVTVVLTYVLKARRKGKLTIDAATAKADGYTFRSNAINIDVVDGSMLNQKKRAQPNRAYDPFEDLLAEDFWGSDPFEVFRKQQQQMMRRFQQQVPQASVPPRDVIKRGDIYKNIFFLVETDKRNVYRGEQINVSYKLYTRLPMEINITKTPDLQGFWSQDVKLPNPPQPVKEIYKGKEYQVFEIKRTAIFPTQTGTLLLDQAKAEGLVRLGEGSEAGDLFDQFFGSLLDEEAIRAMGGRVEEVPVQLQSAPIEIHVKELPLANKPNSFKGAVGQFILESTIDKTEIKENEAATLTLRISGMGNLKTAEPPKVDFPTSLNAFEPVVVDSMVHTSQYIAGYKEIKYTFTPNRAGQFEIPSVNFSYFDPEAKLYKTLVSPVYKIRVLSSDNHTASTPNDIHDIINNPSSDKQSKIYSWIKLHGYWIAFMLPLIAVIAFFAFRRPIAIPTVKKDVPISTTKRPNELAMFRLTRAEEHLHRGDHGAFYQETAKAIWLYLSEKLNIPLAKLSREEAENKLKEMGVDNHLKEDLFRITQACETALYSPNKGTLHMHQIYSDSIRLIGRLETTL